jgi:hypothetical protein
MSVHDLVGNISYVLLAASYLVTNIYWLRALAIVALTAEAAYFYLAGDTTLWVGIVWAGIFNLINITQLGILFARRLRVRMSEEERTLHESVFGRLEKVDFSRILAAGGFRSFAPGESLTLQDHPVEALHLLLAGKARVVADGRVIARLGPGDFAGEMAFIGRCDASATVTVETPCRTFSIAIDSLRALTARHAAIEAAMNAGFSSDLARKLRIRSRSETVPVPVLTKS